MKAKLSPVYAKDLDEGIYLARSTLEQTHYIFKEKVFNTPWQMKKDGYAEATIKATSRRLRMMARAVDLDDPEVVKEYIASKHCKNSFKECLADAYDRYVKYNGLTWLKPNYR